MRAYGVFEWPLYPIQPVRPVDAFWFLTHSGVGISIGTLFLVLYSTFYKCMYCMSTIQKVKIRTNLATTSSHPNPATNAQEA